MGLWRRLGTWLGLSFSADDDESEPRPIDQVIGRMLSDAVPSRIGRAEALGVPAVQRGRNLICSISTLPLVQQDERRRVVDSPLLDQIDPDVANVVTLAQTVEDLLFEGISWWEIVQAAPGGWPMKAKHRDVTSVSLQPPANGKSLAPLPSGEDPRGAVVYVDGRPVPASMMIRFDSPNPGLLKVAGRPIRRALLLDAAASMYADEPRPLDYFTPTDGADPLPDAEIQELLDAWKAARKKRSTAYVPAALQYNEVDQPTPADLQLVELQKRAALDIANSLGLDPEDLGISTTSRTYQNAVDRRQDRINDVLSPYMRAITDRLSMGDVTRAGHRIVFDLDDYLRADPLTRWQVYKIGNEIGAIAVPEIRAEERLPVEPLGGPLPPRRVPAAVGGRAVEASAFAGGSPLHFADLPVTQFSVDVERRTITGTAVPYGEIAQKFMRKFRFLPGSLYWSDMGRVKLLRDHSYTQAIGRAIDLVDGPEEFQASLRVARGEDGDRALMLAEDGVLDGLSVGVDIEDAVPDPDNKGVTLVRRAALREISLVAMPAFDSARVTSVAASRTQGDDVSDTTEPTPAPAEPASVPAAPTETPAAQPTTLTAAPAGPQFSLGDVGQLLAMVQQHGSVGIQPPAAPAPVPVVEPRATVDPTRLTASVTDPAPYRFDREGNLLPGAHDFSTDLINGLRNGDRASYDRAMDFVRVQLDATNTTDTGALNPSRQRPDMYVDQKEYRYPVWEAINKGTLTDVTPFVFPKFSAASGLVSAHTEGTEPSIGDFTATSQTVTPSAISGKAEINREVWDQGGNPQISNLIWRQMTRGWYEALEAAAVAVLDAASPTSLGTFTAGGGTTGQTLSAEMEAYLANLQFIRGGFRFTDAFAQIDLYKGLAGARDDAGRPIYPVLGPNNANGATRSRWGAIDVNGVLFLPAWALAASGSVAASSYLFDREDVHGWASAPQRLDFEYQVKSVFIAIWGYKATAISDISGVREIIFDPAA